MKFAIKEVPAYIAWESQGMVGKVQGSQAMAAIIATVAREDGKVPAEFRLGYGVYDSTMVLDALEKHIAHLEEDPCQYDQGRPRSIERAKKKALWAREIIKTISR